MENDRTTISTTEAVGGTVVSMTVPTGYLPLLLVLMEAFDQACMGKGKERHVFNDAAFRDQQIFEIAEKVGIGFCTGQAVKKLYEQHASLRDDVRDLLGAIVYTAAAVIILHEQIEQQEKENAK